MLLSSKCPLAFDAPCLANFHMELIIGGKAIATEELRYALRMSVVEIPADGKLLTPEALEVVGQKAFRLQDL